MVPLLSYCRAKQGIQEWDIPKPNKPFAQCSLVLNIFRLLKDMRIIFLWAWPSSKHQNGQSSKHLVGIDPLLFRQVVWSVVRYMLHGPYRERWSVVISGARLDSMPPNGCTARTTQLGPEQLLAEGKLCSGWWWWWWRRRRCPLKVDEVYQPSSISFIHEISL